MIFSADAFFLVVAMFINFLIGSNGVRVRMFSERRRVCRYYTVRAHLRHPGDAKRGGCENPGQHAGALLGGVHAGYLHAHNPPDAAGCGGEDRRFYDRGGAVRRWDGQGEQERIAQIGKASPEGKPLGWPFSLIYCYSSMAFSNAVRSGVFESVSSSTPRKVRLIALVRLPTISANVLSAV